MDTLNLDSKLARRLKDSGVGEPRNSIWIAELWEGAAGLKTSIESLANDADSAQGLIDFWISVEHVEIYMARAISTALSWSESAAPDIGMIPDSPQRTLDAIADWQEPSPSARTAESLATLRREARLLLSLLTYAGLDPHAGDTRDNRRLLADVMKRMSLVLNEVADEIA
jgi:hypothetical protein